MITATEMQRRSTKSRWDGKTPSEKAAIMRAVALKRWGKRTAKERNAIMAKVRFSSVKKAPEK